MRDSKLEHYPGLGMQEAYDELHGHDHVNHPRHYTQHPSGVECIDVTEHFNFNIGNAIKYLWRTDLKNSPIENLQKAKWYIEREIERRTKYEEDKDYQEAYRAGEHRQVPYKERI